MMRKFLIFVFLLYAVSFSVGYNFNVAAISSLGAMTGAYVGQTMSTPILIFLNKVGVVKGDIFSPFSTDIYDAMDNGALIGAAFGAVTAKYMYLHEFDLGHLVFDFSISLSSYVLIKEILRSFGFDQFTMNILISPAFQGIAIGGVW